MSDKEFYTLKEICVKFKLYETEVFDLIAKGVIPEHCDVQKQGRGRTHRIWKAASIDAALTGFVYTREFIKASDLCKEFHVGSHCIDAFREDAEFPKAQKVGKYLLFSRKEVADYLETHYRKPRRLEKEARNVLNSAAKAQGVAPITAIIKFRTYKLRVPIKHADNSRPKYIESKVSYVAEHLSYRRGGNGTTLRYFGINYNVGLAWLSLCAKVYGHPECLWYNKYDPPVVARWLVSSLDKLRGSVPEIEVPINQGAALLNIQSHLMRNTVPCREGRCKLTDLAKIWEIPDYNHLLK